MRDMRSLSVKSVARSSNRVEENKIGLAASISNFDKYKKVMVSKESLKGRNVTQLGVMNKKSVGKRVNFMSNKNDQYYKTN